MTKPQQVPSLTELLSWSRPHNSETETHYRKTFIAPFAPETDAFGNHYRRIGDLPILWSCHLDTMASQEGPQRLKQQNNILSLANPKAGRCLGADDGAGIYLMLSMIAAQRPGLYIFHRGEERNGLGSDWIANHNPQILDDIDAAIAFDRAGYSDVITHQMFGRCCSETFANALADELNYSGGDFIYSPCDTGVFTDTANYAAIVPECTNLSVGYHFQHGPRETQNTGFLEDLKEVLLNTDFRDLPIRRAPTPIIPPWDVDEFDDLDEFVYNNPERVAAFLRHHDITIEDVERIS